MPPTLEDVGRFCGVSRSTVSRVINDSPLVNPETKKKVLEAIEEMGYAPNFIARSLTTNRTETIAVTLPDITGGVYPEILAGMDEVASLHSYHLLIVFLGGARPDSTTVQDLVRHRRVDAIVTVASTVGDEDMKALADKGIPLVRTGRPRPCESIANVLFDNRGGARAATELLLKRGCRNLVHISGPEENLDASERSAGFRDAIEAAGLELDPRRIGRGSFVRASGGSVMRDFLDSGIEFDGVFAGNDEMAVGAIEALAAAGISIPDDVAVVGFDDVDVAHFIGLSTVRVPMRQLGHEAAELAFQLIDSSGVAETRVLETELVERASTMRGRDVKPVSIRDTVH
jgi:LacI family transcriptional regulator